MRTIEIIMKYVSRLLCLDDLIEFVIVDGKNQERTRAICDRENYRIYFNKQWLEKVDELEILECVLHEYRHCYQQACIDYPDIFNKEDISVVDNWKNEFDTPIDNPFDFLKLIDLKSIQWDSWVTWVIIAIIAAISIVLVSYVVRALVLVSEAAKYTFSPIGFVVIGFMVLIILIIMGVNSL